MAYTLHPIFGKSTLVLNQPHAVAVAVFNYAARGFRLVIITDTGGTGQII